MEFYKDDTYLNMIGTSEAEYTDTHRRSTRTKRSYSKTPQEQANIDAFIAAFGIHGITSEEKVTRGLVRFFDLRGTYWQFTSFHVTLL